MISGAPEKTGAAEGGSSSHEDPAEPEPCASEDEPDLHMRVMRALDDAREALAKECPETHESFRVNVLGARPCTRRQDNIMMPYVALPGAMMWKSGANEGESATPSGAQTKLMVPGPQD